MPTILACTDGSLYAPSIYQHGAWAAARLGADMRVLHVLYPHHEIAYGGDLTGAIGFDATAPSLHVGSLIQIMMLRWLQKTGGRPIALMGGGTSRVGDPSFKDEARSLLEADKIAENMAGIRSVFSKYLDFGPDRALMADKRLVETTTRVPHAKLGKIVKQVKRFYAHDEEGKAQLGDTVRITETRPLSKLKRWRLVEVIKH